MIVMEPQIVWILAAFLALQEQNAVMKTAILGQMAIRAGSARLATAQARALPLLLMMSHAVSYHAMIGIIKKEKAEQAAANTAMTARISCLTGAAHLGSAKLQTLLSAAMQILGLNYAAAPARI